MLKARPIEEYEGFGTKTGETKSNYYATKSFECWDVVKELCEYCDPWESVLKSNIIKYIWRYPWKGGERDLHKAEDYLIKLIDYVQSKK